jgi:uncharacterized membrane protein YjgN (DUF898 family)
MYDASAALPRERSAGRTLSGLLARLPSLRTADAARSDETAQRAETTVDQTTSASTPVAWSEPKEHVALFAARTFGLTLATFGAYAFWARVENRQRLLGAVSIDGRTLSYHGRGMEGFMSFLMAAALTVIGVTAFFGVVNAMGVDVGDLAFGSFRWQRLWVTLPLLFLLGSVTYRKRHHILKRLQLGGVPFRLTGEAWSYAWLHFWTAFLLPVTAGLAAPWRSMQLEKRKTREMAHGTTTFSYRGRAGELYKYYALLWLAGGLTYLATVILLGVVAGKELLLAIETRSMAPLLSASVLSKAGAIIAAGLIPFLMATAMYRAVWLRHQLSSIRFDGGALKVKLPLVPFAALTFGGTIARIATLGAMGPVVDQAMMRLVVKNLSIEGQYPSPDPATV